MMAVLRRRSRGQRTEAQPRLALRFAVIVGTGLTVAALAIILIVRHLDTVQAERTAAHHARFVVKGILADVIRAQDFTGPVDSARTRELEVVFGERILIESTDAVVLANREGTATYTASKIGQDLPLDRGRVLEALSGTITSQVTNVPSTGGTSTGGARKMLVSYVPVTRSGAAVFFQDYGPIAAAARESFLPIAGTLELVVILLFTLMVPILSRVTKRLSVQYTQIRYLALHDDLTGLPNRLQLRHALEEALERSGRTTVLLFDLDGFKEVNDTVGHDIGDLLLQEIPKRLLPALPADTLFARLGGDEFAILLTGANAELGRLVATSVRERLEAAFSIREISIAIAASIGIAEAPAHGDDPETLLKHADIAMYDAKRRRSGTSVYDPRLDPNDPLRLALLAELRGAIERNEITFYYQPQLDLRTGALTTAEALARWEHPVHGTILPDLWLPLAERAGLHHELLCHMLRRAAEQLRDWEAVGVSLRVSLNLTPLDLLDLDLAGTAHEVLVGHGVDPARIDFEITEGAFISNPDRVRRVLHALSTMGCRIEIDDFGTGYSSLAYLSTLPANGLKIDRSFVTGMVDNPRNREIVRSTIELGHSLGLHIVAEGVETEQELAALTAMGCDFAQGYYVGRPRTAAALTARLLCAQHPRSPPGPASQPELQGVRSERERRALPLSSPPTDTGLFRTTGTEPTASLRTWRPDHGMSGRRRGMTLSDNPGPGEGDVCGL
jgi:diguanylate cyclase (GGDEF)-like protein